MGDPEVSACGGAGTPTPEPAGRGRGDCRLRLPGVISKHIVHLGLHGDGEEQGLVYFLVHRNGFGSSDP